MPIKSKFVAAAGCTVALTCLFAQDLAAQTWKLPDSTTVKDSGPRTYRFTVVYNTANTRGELLSRHRLIGEYTRGLEGSMAVWKNVTQSDAPGLTAPFGATEKVGFMEGFRYLNDKKAAFQPDFFKAFPPTAVFERNLIWDTGMIEDFGQNFFPHLKLNEPYHIISDQDAKMPGLGTFHNRDVVLEWIGRSQRNGQECAVIKYEAFLNPLEVATGGMTLNGRSDYWGEIWVSIDTRQIEYATLQELVVGEMKLAGQDAAQVLNIFRIGTFEPVSAQ